MSLSQVFLEMRPHGVVDMPQERLERHCERLVRWASRTRPDALAYQVSVAFRHYKRKLIGDTYQPMRRTRK